MTKELNSGVENEDIPLVEDEITEESGEDGGAARCRGKQTSIWGLPDAEAVAGLAGSSPPLAAEDLSAQAVDAVCRVYCRCTGENGGELDRRAAPTWP